LEVALLKQCTQLRREAHFEVNNEKHKKNTACSEHFRRSANVFVVGAMHSAPEHTCTVAFTGAPAFLSAFAGLSELSRQLTSQLLSRPFRGLRFDCRESSRVNNLYKFFPWGFFSCSWAKREDFAALAKNGGRAKMDFARQVAGAA